MGLFGKKKKSKEEEELDDDDDLEDEEESGDKRTLKRTPLKKKDFKDLSPENKKTRKEPIKPWGKKERFLVLSVMILTALISGIAALSARNYKLPGVPRIKFPQNLLSFLS